MEPWLTMPQRMDLWLPPHIDAVIGKSTMDDDMAVDRVVALPNRVIKHSEHISKNSTLEFTQAQKSSFNINKNWSKQEPRKVDIVSQGYILGLVIRELSRKELDFARSKLTGSYYEWGIVRKYKFFEGYLLLNHIYIQRKPKY